MEEDLRVSDCSRKTAHPSTTVTTSTSSPTCLSSIDGSQFSKDMDTVEHAVQGIRRGSSRWYRQWHRNRNRWSLQSKRQSILRHQDLMGQEEEPHQKEHLTRRRQSRRQCRRQHTSKANAAVRRSRLSGRHTANTSKPTSSRTTFRSMGSIGQIKKSSTEALLALQL